MIAACVALIAVSALCYRIRGSSYFATWPLWFFGVARGDRLAKLAIGAAPVALASWIAGVPPLWCLGVWAGVMLADTLPHAAFQGVTTPLQELGMSALGIAQAAAPAAALWLAGHYSLSSTCLALGLLAGPAYFLGNRLPLNLGRGDMALEQGPVNGEWFYGAARVLFALWGVS